MKISKEQYEKLIMDAPLDKWIELEVYGHILKDVEFELKEGGYSWSGEYSWKNGKRVGYVFPMKNSNDIKYFKTLKGAKRNFIKRFEFLFKKERQEERKVISATRGTL